MNRTTERKIVFEIVFALPFNNEKSAEQLIDIYAQANEVDAFSPYIVSTVNGIFDNLASIDEKIEASIKGRKFDRLDKICLAAMRYATYEMFYNDDIPDTVAINEAIELTKKYDDSLSAFVHGNLGIISKFKNE